MNVLVINSGSSSIKFQLFDMPGKDVIASGLVEKIGLENGEIHYKTSTVKKDIEIKIPDHAFGLKEVVKLLLDKQIGVIRDVNEIDAVGHRVVHGGNNFIHTTFINQDVKAKIKSLFSLAPLHNPPNLKGIEVAEEVFSEASQIAVFDTSFHQSLPEKAYTYAIDKKFRDENHIRVYGFHGISHKYVSQRAVEFLGKKDAKLITIHLGNGCSMTAIQNGKSLDHSLGFGPNEGLVMGTRSGDMDSSVIFYLMDKLGYSAKQVSDLLSKESGMLGLTGESDLRTIEANATNGDKNCQLALEINAYRIKKYIGAYTAAMNGVDALVFTAGIGENSDVIRTLVCEDMDYLGIKINDEKNQIRAKEIRSIQADDSRVQILVIPTNEELEIANACFALKN